MKYLLIPFLSFTVFISSCGGLEENASLSPESKYDEGETMSEEIDDVTESSSEDYSQIISSVSMKPRAIDSSKKFIRKGNLRFKTSNVFKTTQAIENVVFRFDGWVSNTNLKSNITYNRQFKLSEDSILHVQKHCSENDIILRIPYNKLDTALKLIANEIDYLDHRNLSTTDITFDLLAENLKQTRLNKYTARLENKNSSTEADDISLIANNLLEKQEMKENAYLEELKQNDQIKYSSLQISIYEPEKTKETRSLATTKYKDATTPYSNRATESLGDGLNFVKELSLLIIAGWPLWIIGSIVFIVYKKRRRVKK